MTITIRSTVSDKSLSIAKVGSDETSVWTGELVGIDVNRAEFLAAVATELDCIIIPRTDLPEVGHADDGPHGCDLRVGERVVPVDTRYDTPDLFREVAHRYLAVAEYLDAHPPVDEAQVNALAAILGDFAIADEHDGTRNDQQLARLLVQRGITVKED